MGGVRVQRVCVHSICNGEAKTGLRKKKCVGTNFAVWEGVSHCPFWS